MSEGPYASLNLGRKTDDNLERVDENRRIMCRAVSADLEKLALNDAALSYEIGAAYEVKRMNKQALEYFQRSARLIPGFRDVQDRVRRNHRLPTGQARPEPVQQIVMRVVLRWT